jgi:hypothetical protein
MNCLSQQRRSNGILFTRDQYPSSCARLRMPGLRKHLGGQDHREEAEGALTAGLPVCLSGARAGVESPKSLHSEIFPWAGLF